MKEFKKGDTVKTKGGQFIPMTVESVYDFRCRCVYEEKGVMKHATFSKNCLKKINIMENVIKEFKKGDIVRIKGGQITMTVCYCHDDYCMCRYEMNGKVHSLYFKKDDIEKVIEELGTEEKEDASDLKEVLERLVVATELLTAELDRLYKTISSAGRFG